MQQMWQCIFFCEQIKETFLNAYSGLKSNKYTQCKFASVYANALNKRLGQIEKHSREMSNIYTQ